MKSLPKWAGILGTATSVLAIAQGPAITAWLNGHGVAGQIAVIVIGAVASVVTLLAHSLPGTGGK